MIKHLMLYNVALVAWNKISTDGHVQNPKVPNEDETNSENL